MTKLNSKNIYLVAYHKNLTMYVSICIYKDGKFTPINSIGNINNAVINQDPNLQIEDFLSISNLTNLLDK